MSQAHSLVVTNLRKQFGKTEIIRGVDLAVNAGERVAIIGPNGAGKSTLFNLISGRFAPSSGEIHLHGQRIDGLKPLRSTDKVCPAVFKSPIFFPSSACLKTCAALFCGAWVTATVFGHFSAVSRTRTSWRTNGCSAYIWRTKAKCWP